MCWRRTRLNKSINIELSEKQQEIDNLQIKIDSIQNINKQKDTIITNISNEKLDMQKSLEQLNSKLQTCHIAANDQQILTEVLNDKLKELNTDNHDKDSIINELTNRYNKELDKFKLIIAENDKNKQELIETQQKLNKQLEEYKTQQLFKNIVIFYFVGYNYKKDPVDLEYDIKKFMDNKISEVHIGFDTSMYTALENMKSGKNLHKIRNTKKIVKEAFDNIIVDLNNEKKIILIGENYGGAIVNRLLDMFITHSAKFEKLAYLDNLFTFTFGSFYNPDRHLIQKSLSKYINSEHIYNYIYKNDLSANYDVGDQPPNIDNDSWTMNPKTLLRWKETDIKDTSMLMNNYDVLNSVKKTIVKLGII